MTQPRIRTTDWDRLATSAPTNRQAAMDYGASGDAPSERMAGGCVFVGPPRMRPFDPQVKGNLTGRTFGRLTVLGLRAKLHGDGAWAPVRWVCRCTCGNYTLRRHDKLIRKDSAADEMCPVCDQRERERRRDKSAKGSNKQRRKAEAAWLDRLAERGR